MRKFFGNGAACIACLLYTSDAADDGESVDLGGRRIIKKKKKKCFFFFSFFLSFFFFQAEDGIRDQPRSRGLGDVYKRQSRKIVKEFNVSIKIHT